MYAGRIVEMGLADEIIEDPLALPLYERPGLVDAQPPRTAKAHRYPGRGRRPCAGRTLRGVASSPGVRRASPAATTPFPVSDRLPQSGRCAAQNGVAHHRSRSSREPPSRDRWLSGSSVRRLQARVTRVENATVVAAEDVSFEVAGGECVALVGESGSGKTTIARCVVGLHPPRSGEDLPGRTTTPRRAGDRTREDRRRVQIIFQNLWRVAESTPADPRRGGPPRGCPARSLTEGSPG